MRRFSFSPLHINMTLVYMKPFPAFLWKHFVRTSQAKSRTTFVVNLAPLCALGWKQPGGFMAPQPRRPCAAGMLHHVDVNTEQVFTATASYFTYLCDLCVSRPVIQGCGIWLPSVQTGPCAIPNLRSVIWGDSLCSHLHFRTKYVNLFKNDDTAGCTKTLHVTSPFMICGGNVKTLQRNIQAETTGEPITGGLLSLQHFYSETTGCEQVIHLEKQLTPCLLCSRSSRATETAQWS